MFRDMRFMLGFDMDLFTKACWMVFTPLLLLGIFVYTIAVFEVPTYNGRPFPDLAYGKNTSLDHEDVLRCLGLRVRRY